MSDGKLNEPFFYRVPHPEVGDLFGSAATLIGAKRACTRLSIWDGAGARRAEIKFAGRTVCTGRCPGRAWIWTEAP